MKFFKITSLYKLIYLAVIVLLFYINYSREVIHSHNIQGLEITETSFIEVPLIPKKIKSLKLNYKGLSFDISIKKPIRLVTEDGVVRKSRITDIGTFDDSLQVNLENSVTIFFRVDKNGERLTVNSTIPKVFPTISEISIPYFIEASYNIEATDLSYKIFNESEEFHLKFNDSYEIDDVKKSFRLKAENDKVSTLTFSPLDTNQLPLVEQWYMKHREVQPDTVEKQISEYLDIATKTLINRYDSIRYYPGTISTKESWKNLPIRGEFSERGIIIYLAQAMAQGDFQRSLNNIRGIKNRFPSSFGYDSSPFLGNIVKNGEDGTEKDIELLKGIQNKISNSDEKLFKTRIPNHYFEGTQLNLSKLEKLINDKDKLELNLNELSISLYHLLAILESKSTNSDTIDSIKEITDLIINKIHWDNSGLYLTDNKLDSLQLLNLQTGQLLIRASQHETSEYSKPIGEGLIQTFINNSSSKGLIKESYNLESREFSAKGILLEDTIMLFNNNPHLPHYYQDKGIKIWTMSDSIEVKKSSKEIKIKIAFPVDSNTKRNSHFLVISGIKPYKQLYYKGKPWRSEPNFEKWRVGYYYDHNTQLLYFMPNHKKNREEIVLTY